MGRPSKSYAISLMAVALCACGDGSAAIAPAASSDAGPSHGGSTADAGLVPTGDLLEVATALGLSSLVDAANTASVADALRGDGPLTLLAPTNSALAQVAVDDGALLANVLLNHVAEGARVSDALSGGDSFVTLAGTRLVVDPQAGAVGGGLLTERVDITATNGVLHVLSTAVQVPLVAEVAAVAEGLSAFGQLVDRASTRAEDPLFGGSARTVFAPNAEAFAGLDVSRLPISDADRLLGAHHLAGQLLEADLTDGRMLTMSDGTALIVQRRRDGLVLVDGDGRQVRVMRTNIRLANGVVHVIEQTIDPAPTQVEEDPANVLVVANRNGYSALTIALQNAGLGRLLTSDGPFTLFAPPDDQLNRLARTIRDPVLLQGVLLNHIVDGDLPVAVLQTEPFWTARSGHALAVMRRSPVGIAGATITTADLDATNGVVHGVAAVLVPPTLLEAIAAAADLTAFNRALLATSRAFFASLAAQPVTVFAPTDPAFDGIDLRTLTATDAEALVGRHIVQGVLLAGQLGDGTELTTISGQTVVVRRNRVAGYGLEDPAGQIAPFQIDGLDLRCSDGVLHRISSPTR